MIALVLFCTFGAHAQQKQKTCAEYQDLFNKSKDRFQFFLDHAVQARAACPEKEERRMFFDSVDFNAISEKAKEKRKKCPEVAQVSKGQVVIQDQCATEANEWLKSAVDLNGGYGRAFKAYRNAKSKKEIQQQPESADAAQ